MIGSPAGRCPLAWSAVFHRAMAQFSLPAAVAARHDAAGMPWWTRSRMRMTRRRPPSTHRTQAAAPGSGASRQRVVPRGPALDGSDDAWWESPSEVPAQTRALFEEEVRKGQAAMNSATAALLISREDDALMTNCVAAVALPVEPFLRRMSTMADEIAGHHLPRLGADPPQDVVVTTVASYIFDLQRFRVAARPAIRRGDVLEHPGVWEDPRGAYLNEVLTRREGSPAALAIIFAEVWQQLLMRGAVTFAVSTDVDLPARDERGYERGALTDGFPFVVRSVTVGGMGRGASSSTALAHLNTCSSRALVLLLRQLKRGYWPWAWDTTLDDPRDGESGSGGGFLAAARAFLDEMGLDCGIGHGRAGGVDATTAAISAAAAHRLARGVWTSSGAGDLRRARAAAERLVILCCGGDIAGLRSPGEKRDLAVLLVHCGEFSVALDLLRDYQRDRGDGEEWEPSIAEESAVEALVRVLPAIIMANDELDSGEVEELGGSTGGEALETRRKIPWALPHNGEGPTSNHGRGRSLDHSHVISPSVAPRRRTSIGSIGRARHTSSLAVSATASSSLMATQPPLVVVIGASGRTGAEVVRHCVSTGRLVRACTRSGAFDLADVLGEDVAAAAAVPWSSPLVTSAQVDVTQPDTLPAAVAGAALVVFAATAPANGNPDEVDHLGLVNVAKACIASNVPRLVIVSGAGVTKPQSPAYRFLNMFGGRMDAKVAGEDAVRKLYRSADGGVSYTVVRPSGLLDGPAKGPSALAFNQGDEAAGFINRADVAECCVYAGDAASAAGVTFEVYDTGTAVATATLSVADILSDAKVAALVALVTGLTFRRIMHGDDCGSDAVTARERRGVDYAALLQGLQPDE